MTSQRSFLGRSIDSRWLAAGGLLLVLAAGLAAGWAGSRILGPASLSVGDPAPRFEVETLDGGRISSAQFEGRPYAILFFSVDCRHCRDAVPDMVAMLNRVGRAAIVPILVSRDWPSETLAFLDDRSLASACASDRARRLEKIFGISGVPSVCLAVCEWDEPRLSRKGESVMQLKKSATLVTVLCLLMGLVAMAANPAPLGAAKALDDMEMQELVGGDLACTVAVIGYVASVGSLFALTPATARGRGGGAASPDGGFRFRNFGAAFAQRLF